jgi:hypothetical protein
MSYSLFDVRVLAFSLTISVLTGLLFGVLPFFSIGHAYLRRQRFWQTRDRESSVNS